MNRTVLVLKMLTGVFALAVFLSPVSASEKPESPVAPVNITYKKYLSEGDFFAVSIPDGWSKEEKDFAHAYTRTGDKVCGVELSGPHNGDARPTISVLYYEYGQFFKNYGGYISLKTGSFTRIAPEKDVSITNTTVAGREAKKFEIEKFELIPLPFDPPDSKEGIMYEIAPPSKKVTIMERYIVIPAEKGFYVLSYRAPEGIAKEHESVFNKVVSSFEPHEKQAKPSR